MRIGRQMSASKPQTNEQLKIRGDKRIQASWIPFQIYVRVASGIGLPNNFDIIMNTFKIIQRLFGKWYRLSPKISNY